MLRIRHFFESLPRGIQKPTTATLVRTRNNNYCALLRILPKERFKQNKPTIKQQLCYRSLATSHEKIMLREKKITRVGLKISVVCV